jgi:hypothetical protein
VAVAYGQYTRDFGVGYNHATGALMGNCVTFDRPSFQIKSRNLSYTLEYVQNVETLRRALNISGNASYKGAWGSVDAKTEFFRSISLDTYSLYMLLRGDLKSDFIAAQNPRITAEIRQKLTPAQFFQQCGDEYISGVRYGGAVYGLLIINTSSLQEKEELAAKLTAATNVGVDATGSLQSSFSRLLTSINYHIKYFQEGGSTNSLPSKLDNIDQFFTFAKSVEANILANPAVLDVQTKSYRTLDGTLSRAANRDQLTSLRAAARLEGFVSQRLLDLAGVRAEPWRFIDVKPEAIDADIATLSKLADQISDFGADCFSDDSACRTDDVGRLEAAWQKLATPLPRTSPLYHVFTYYGYTPNKRHIRRNTDCATSNSYLDYNLTTQLGDLRIIDGNKVRYEFLCLKTDSYYNCNGGDDHSDSGTIYKFRGAVLADISVSGHVLKMSNVHVECGCEPECAEDLLKFIKAKDGAVIDE